MMMFARAILKADDSEFIKIRNAMRTKTVSERAARYNFRISSMEKDMFE